MKKYVAACQLLGEYLESITREISKAFQIFESNCVDNNHGPSCNKAGYYKITGNEHVSKDPVRFKCINPFDIHEYFFTGFRIQVLAERL